MNQYGMAPPQHAAPPVQTGGGQLEVHLSFFFLQWILFLVSPRIVINGYPQTRSWGRNVIDLPAGQYQLEVFFPYLFMQKCGPARTVVTVHPGCVTKVKYSAPFFLFMDGSINVAAPQPMQGAYPQMQGHPGYQQLPPR